MSVCPHGGPCDHYPWCIGSHCTVPSPRTDSDIWDLFKLVHLRTLLALPHQNLHLVAIEAHMVGKWAILRILLEFLLKTTCVIIHQCVRACVCVCVCVWNAILLVIHSLQHIPSEEKQLFLLGKLSKFKHNMRKSNSTRYNFFFIGVAMAATLPNIQFYWQFIS